MGETVKLFVCGTPLGNLEDASPRLRRVLASVDIVAAEDTRVARQLLSALGIESPRLISIREENQREATAQIIELLKQGKTVALTTDAGMPGVSDPGPLLVSNCRRQGIAVEVVPGPSAPTTALAACGVAADRFVFDGFLPARGAEREARLDAIYREPRVVVLFEAPHRVVQTLSDLASRMPDRIVHITRELTKKFEEVRSGRLDEVLPLEPRGEYTLVLEAWSPPQPEANAAELDEFLLARRAAGDGAKAAATAAAELLGVNRKAAYRRFTELSKS